MLGGAGEVEVVDHGSGFDPKLPPAPPPTRQAGGWGLYLLDRVATAWGVERPANSTSVWFELNPEA